MELRKKLGFDKLTSTLCSLPPSAHLHPAHLHLPCLAAGALPPLLAQLHSAHTPATVKESAVRSLDSLIQSSVPHAAAICTPEVRRYAGGPGRRWAWLKNRKVATSTTHGVAGRHGRVRHGVGYMLTR